VRCQDPGAPGALLEPPDSPDRNLTGTWQNRAGLPGGLHVTLTLEFLTGPCQEPDRTVSAVRSPPGPRQY